MKKTSKLALIVLALALGISACARLNDAPATRQTPQPNDATSKSLEGGLVLGAATLQPTINQQPTLPPMTPTLVPTITIPKATLPPITPAATTTATAAIAAAAALPNLPPVDAACLTGTWQVTDLQQAMAGSLAQSGASLVLEGVSGQARYVFNADGSMALTYQQLSAVLNGTVENRPVRVAQSLDGTATARYTVDAAAGVIEMSAFGGEGIRSALEINGQTLAEGSLPVWLAFTRGQGQSGGAPAVVQSSRAAVTCDGRALTLQPLEPVPGPVLALERVEEQP